MTPKNSHPPLTPRVVELDGADRCAKGAEPVCPLCYGGNVDGAHINAALQATPRIVFAHIDLPGAEELAPLEIKPENLATARPIGTQADGRNKHLGALAQVCQISAESRQSNLVVASHWRVELERSIALQVQTLGVVRAEEEEGGVLGLGVAGEGQGQFLGRVNMELGLVCPRAHDPVAIIANSDAVARCWMPALSALGVA